MGWIRAGLSAATGVAVVVLMSVSAVEASTTADVTDVSAVGAVVVNEFAPSGLFGSSTDEYVELRNTSDNSVVLAGWQLHACLAPGSTKLVKVFGSSDVIGPGEHLWLAHVGHDPALGSPLPDGRYSTDVPDGGGWLLSDPFSGYADGVGLGSGLDCTEGSPAPGCDWDNDQAVTRDENGEDTDDNAADFSCESRTPSL